MKISLFLAVVIIAGSSFFPAKNVSPTIFSYKLNWCNRDGSVKSALETATAAYQKPKGNSAVASYSIAGINSSLRIRVDYACFTAVTDKITAKEDPAAKIELYKLAIGKNNRTYSPGGDANSVKISLSFSSEETFVYRILLATALQPGEYAFVDKSTTAADGNVIVWTFGID